MAQLPKVAMHSLRTIRSHPLRRVPALARWQTTSNASTEPKPATASSDAPGQTLGLERSSEQAVDAQPRHQPDYDVTIDYRTSTFSPIPLRVMDGSEPGLNTPAAVLSGAPTDLQGRTVRIYKPAKPATQSGNWTSHHWRMDWDVLGKGHRWENPLMGWQSSADYMQGTHLSFKSKEDAINFANKQGYEYFVQEPNERKIVPKQYATQFVHSPKKLKQVRTK